MNLNENLFKDFGDENEPHCIPFTCREFERALVQVGYSKADAMGIISGVKDAYKLLYGNIIRKSVGVRDFR